MSTGLTQHGFFKELSESPRLKFLATVVTVIFLVCPLAVLVAFGLSEKIALFLLLIAIVPVHYLVFLLLHKRRT
jgi:hypothetical protein